MKVFLSASVPDSKRENEYTGDIKVTTIRDAIMAFTKVCAEWNIPFYFGGHPAISPLVYMVASQYTEAPKIAIYQSEYFRGMTPIEINYFNNIHWTHKIGESLIESVNVMRETMFNENQDTEIAVFIGGMRGIIDEANIIQAKYPNVELIPLASTGGASVDLYNKINCEITSYKDSYAFISLFKTMLERYRNNK